MRRRVTFSRNVTLSLSRTCQCFCKYCAFATHRAHIHDPVEVERRLDEAEGVTLRIRPPTAEAAALRSLLDGPPDVGRTFAPGF